MEKKRFNLLLGDKVVVKKQIPFDSDGCHCGNLFWNPRMNVYRGKTITINHIKDSNDGEQMWYECEERLTIPKDAPWTFNQKMFTKASMERACKGR